MSSLHEDSSGASEDDGYFTYDKRNMESVPLTPRAVESLEESSSTSSSSSLSTARSRSTYLSFFRSPIDTTYSRHNRTPLYPLPEQRADDASSASSYLADPYGFRPQWSRRTSNDSSSVFQSVDEVSEDGLSMLSSSSHLFGEQLVPSFSRSSLRTADDLLSQAEEGRTSVQSPFTRHRTTLIGELRTLWQRPPSILSPRSRNLADLHYLTSSHAKKIEQWSIGDREPYDFCLILQPQQVYGFWAALLDFRAELLGPESLDGGLTIPAAGTDETESPTSSSSSSSDDSSLMRPLPPPTTQLGTPLHASGLRRRGPTPDWRRSSTKAASVLQQHSPVSSTVLSYRSSVTRRSVFERALGCDMEPQRSRSLTAGSIEAMTTPGTAMQPRRRWGNQAAGPYTPSMISPPIRSLTRGSSMTQRTKVPLARLASGEEEEEEDEPVKDANELRMEDIPPQRFARGIAARTNGMLPFLSALKRGIVLRKHRAGQEAVFCKLYSDDGGDTIRYEILEHDDAMPAFKEQRVRYNKIKYEGQGDEIVAQPWSCADEAEDDENNRFSVPDYVAAKQYREKMSRERSVSKRLNNLATRMVRGGAIKAGDVAVVHPGRFHDPRSPTGELSTVTFRRSKSEYNPELSFSLVMRTDRLLARSKQISIDEYENRWLTGEGNDSHFKYHDFEVATVGEYWLIFRGFLLLHRDAAVGRFAEQRAAGIGSHYSRIELEQREKADLDLYNRLHVDEFHEPVTIGCVERLVMKMRDVDPSSTEGYTLPGAMPPPSDYFLGFRSPGTAIWSRLRLASLETSRVYSLDPNRVMIKVRCPPERLMDVAEVLRVKLKTREGTFAPFREDMMEIYEDSADPLESPPCLTNPYGLTFRSSVRQRLIDFIIGSRIRDSGAELSQTTDLGKMIQARVPLHMHSKLEAIYNSWFYFWRKENWQGRDGRSLTHAVYDDEAKAKTEETGSTDTASTAVHDERMPNKVTRFLVGSFYQPLDSIEQYFGEKVAFYYGWLQHTATHLLFLAAAGFVLFVFQIGSGNFDHPLRPLFAVLVMLWTFIVLINWKKRANFLAYRWGTMNYKEQETTRPQFQGDYARDEVTGEWVVIYPRWKRWLKYSLSFPLTLLFTAGSLILIFWVHSNRDLQLASYMESQNNSTTEEFQLHFAFGETAQMVKINMTREMLLDPAFWFIVVGLPSMLGLCLPLLNLILMKISVMLNDFENYRTESEYRTYLIIKVFSFRFVCYFATLYYYAFVSIGSPQALENGMLRVATGVLVYTTVAQWWQNFLHVCFPIVIRKIRLRHRRNRLCEELREIEIEEEAIAELETTGETDEELEKRRINVVNKRLLLDQAQDDLWLEVMLPQHDSFPEYIQAVVQFTYVSCFSVVLPITPIIVLFNYLLCMRLDAYKLCKGRRRPLAEKTGGIGIWEHILHIVAVISVLTNCWLMGFTSSVFIEIGNNVGQLGLFAIVVGWEHIMLLIKYVMQKTISPLPKSVRDALKREEYELEQQRSNSIRVRRLQYQRDEDFHPHLPPPPPPPNALDKSSGDYISRPLVDRETSSGPTTNPEWTPGGNDSTTGVDSTNAVLQDTVTAAQQHRELRSMFI